MTQKIVIRLFLTVVSIFLQSVGLLTLEQWMIAIGKAFGPDGCRHWSELTPEEQTAILTRAPSLGTDHDDWNKALSWVPRTLTTYVMPGDQPPVIIWGTGTIVDIPEPGTSVATRGYVATTTQYIKALGGKLHNRFGWRWDYNSLTLEFPAYTWKVLKGGAPTV